LAVNLRTASQSGNLTSTQAEAFVSNPNALIDPVEKAAVPLETLSVLQSALASSIRPVFWVGAFVSILALFAVAMLPRYGDRGEEVDGEKLIMAEQTAINARNQPTARYE
ncbi:MAG: hypothetical protein LC730_02260, partial [Acidobacteria bacterium]|nr:hypothetical protein [Acidobacteriota bacterium]MCA1608265.1 hypothetical protein [Acidobacteriota bacterium]